MIDRIGPRRPIRWYLKEWREKRGLTQEQLADRMETNKGQVSKLERGAQRMNDEWIAGCAFALGVEPGDLLKDPNAPCPHDLLSGATPEQREKALKMIAIILDRAV